LPAQPPRTHGWRPKGFCKGRVRPPIRLSRQVSRVSLALLAL